MVLNATEPRSNLRAWAVLLHVRFERLSVGSLGRAAAVVALLSGEIAFRSGEQTLLESSDC